MTKQETFGMAQNPHIVVDDATGRCLCGIYNGKPVRCEQIIAELRSMEAVAWNTREVIAALSKAIIDLKEVEKAAYWVKHPWDKNEPMCVKCSKSLSLRDGCEWNDDPDFNLCLDCTTDLLQTLMPVAEEMCGALKDHHNHDSQECEVAFIQGGKPIAITTDLGASYSESLLSEKTQQALFAAHSIGLKGTK